MPQLTFFAAIRDAIDLSMAADPAVYVLGLGVADPRGVFGTTLGLLDKYGSQRVMDMPTAENGMTGVAIGSALVGMRPILVHQRLDFALLSMEQIVNQAAKWHYMFSGQKSLPLVIRLVIGRGWGQGPQHSQSLQAWFAHIPGLKVVMPATPYDAKGLLMASIADDNPVIFLEHRWLHNTFGAVPDGPYEVPLGQARVVRPGTDLTIAATSYMVLEALRSAELLAAAGIDVEVLDLRTLRPLDSATILASVRKTGRFLAADTGWKVCGMAGELLALVAEEAFASLKCRPRRVGLLDCPIPTSPALARHCYPRAVDMVTIACDMLDIAPERVPLPDEEAAVPLDVPDPSFSGPF
jgi:pyruvate dehydrogenase E1 component beta subunit